MTGCLSLEPVSFYMRLCRAAQAMQTELTDSTPNGSGLAAHSRFFQRLHRRYGTDLALLPPGPPVRAIKVKAPARGALVM